MVRFLTPVKSVYDDSACSVCIINMYTSMFNVSCGVKQGCLNSPTLFAMYVNDLATVIKSLNKGIDIVNINVSILLYADDIVLISPNGSNLQCKIMYMNGVTNGD